MKWRMTNAIAFKLGGVLAIGIRNTGRIGLQRPLIRCGLLHLVHISPVLWSLRSVQFSDGVAVKWWCPAFRTTGGLRLCQALHIGPDLHVLAHDVNVKPIGEELVELVDGKGPRSARKRAWNLATRSVRY